jgi:lipopolysaccharide biosynthesis protein
MGVPFGFVDGAAPSGLRIAAAIHMFHPELSSEFRQLLERIPGPLDAVLSTDSEHKRTEIIRHFDGWAKGALDVRVVANRGRDIAPKLTAYQDLHDRYDLILYLHSKRSGNLVDGTAWRHYLLHTLAGTPAIAASILEAFRADPNLGLIMPQHWPQIRGWVHWSTDFAAARDMARRLGLRLTPAHVVDFPSGSMFWARPAALRPLFDLGLRVEDFAEEAGQIEGTPAHAVERLFLYACELAGYRWAKVCDPAQAGHAASAVPIGTPVALGHFRERYGYRLIAKRAAASVKSSRQPPR